MESTREILKVRELNNHILEIKLHRPDALNTLNAEVIDKLHNVLLAAKNNQSIKAILLTGEGKAFCAGADINQLEMLGGQTGYDFARHGQKVFDLFEQLGKPTL